jgi:hypothetical protein
LSTLAHCARAFRDLVGVALEVLAATDRGAAILECLTRRGKPSVIVTAVGFEQRALPGLAVDRWSQCGFLRRP